MLSSVSILSQPLDRTVLFTPVGTLPILSDLMSPFLDIGAYTGRPKESLERNSLRFLCFREIFDLIKVCNLDLDFYLDLDLIVIFILLRDFD